MRKGIGEVRATWSRGTAKGFVLQYAMDPSNPTTLSTPVSMTRTKYTLDGQPSGSTVHFRVAAMDSTETSGHGPWSAWVAGTVR
jgi:hypothetical protein